MQFRVHIDHPPCGHCGAAVVRRPGEAATNYRKRKTCSHECGIALSATRRYSAARKQMAKLKATKTCAACNTPLTPHKGEGVKNFAKRQTCSISCANRVRYGAAKRPRKASAPSTRPGRPVKAPRPAGHQPAPFTGFPDPRVKVARVAVAMQRQFAVTYCAHHPREALTAYGACPACVAGASWAKRQGVRRPSWENR